MKRFILKFGTIAGLGLSAMMALSISLIHDTGTLGMLVGYTTMVLAFSLVYFGVRSYRDTEGNGSISFGRAFVLGIAITSLASLFYVGTWEIMYYKFMPDFGTKYAAAAVEKARAAGASQAKLDATKAEMDKFAELYKNPVINAAMTFLEPLPVGLIMALVCAAMLRRKADGNERLAVAT